MVEVRAAQRGPKMLLALEDVRLRPANEIARFVAEAEMDIETNVTRPEESEGLPAGAPHLVMQQFPLADEEVDKTKVQQVPQREDGEEAPPEPSAAQVQKESVLKEDDTVQSSAPTADTPLTALQAPASGKTDRTIGPEAESSEEAATQQEVSQKQPLRRGKRIKKPSAKLRGTYVTGNHKQSDMHGYTLNLQQQELLKKLYDKYSNEQFTKGKAPDIPEWLYWIALEEEMANWGGHYKACEAKNVQRGANVAGSHLVYRIKRNDDGTYKFKARLVVHGNEDAEKDDIRKDTATAHLTTVRLLLSLAVCYGFTIGKIDIKAAYFQSGDIKRKIYVRPPREKLQSRILWELISLPYGILEAGRQWQLASDDFLTSIGLTPLYLLPQGFMLRDKKRGLQLLVAKVVDDFLLAGTESALQWFSKKINARFQVGTEVYAPKRIRFNGFSIMQDAKGNVEVCMKEFADSIEPLELPLQRRKQQEDLVTEKELKAYQSLAGKMNWLGHCVVPHYSFAASYLQQQLSELRVKHLVQANGVLKEMKRYHPTLVYGRCMNVTEAFLCTFADASFPKAAGSIYGQSGILCGFVLGSGPTAPFHPIAWISHKQTRVCRSSTAAEILAIAEAEELGTVLCTALGRICGRSIPHELNIDSRSLFEAMVTQHELKDFRLRQAGQGLRASFEVGDIAVIRWIAGRCNPADALTKRSPSTGPLLSDMCVTGKLLLKLNEGTLTTAHDPTKGKRLHCM